MNSQTTTQTSADEDAIRAIHQRMIDAWNTGDAVAFGPLRRRGEFRRVRGNAHERTPGDRLIPSADIRHGRERNAPSG